MSDLEIDEKIKVWAFFDDGIFPIAMNWRRRYIKFEKLLLKTSKRIGNVKFTSLICAAADSTFELEMNNENNLWTLKKVMNND
ncbi:MAG TPA: hypothetical protein VLE91_04910 [Candidatus Saccharimonadales bacterium]|nr:hypothetical protein [Candidatus Saccharimonadales bacterium]